MLVHSGQGHAEGECQEGGHAEREGRHAKREGMGSRATDGGSTTQNVVREGEVLCDRLPLGDTVRGLSKHEGAVRRCTQCYVGTCMPSLLYSPAPLHQALTDGSPNLSIPTLRSRGVFKASDSTNPCRNCFHHFCSFSKGAGSRSLYVRASCGAPWWLG